MRLTRILLIPVLVAAIFGLAVAPSFAQTPGVVRAEVDRIALTTDEALLLTVTIDASEAQDAQPTLPDLDSFNLLGSSRSTQMSLVNGNMSINTVYSYQLQPTETGALVIPPITVTAASQTYQTEPITVNVTQGNGQSQPANPSLPAFPSIPGFGQFPSLSNFPNFPSFPSMPSSPRTPATALDPREAPADLTGQDLFVEAKVDNTSPFQGEQVLYTVRVYQATNQLTQIEYQLPDFRGFWSEQLPDQAEYSLEAAGRNYRVVELKTVLFPTVVDSLVINPTTILLPGGLFSSGQTLRTQQLTVDVRPLPDNAPADFQGAVGQYAIAAETDTVEVTMDDTVTFRVTINGTGNPNTLPDPQWNEGPDWRAFDSQANVTTHFEDGALLGARAYKRVLIPTTPGSLTLPSIAYTYFDPAEARYETVRTEPITVLVEAGAAGASLPPLRTVGTGSEMVGTEALRPLKPAPSTWFSGSRHLVQQPGFWLLSGLPLVVLVGHAGWRRYQSHREDNSAERRGRRAARRAQQALQAAANSPESAHQTASTILDEYLAARLDSRIDGLTHQELGQRLLSTGASPELVAQVQETRIRCEMGRYAPAKTSADSGDVLAEVGAIVAKLEQVLQ